ncbi:thiamine diphosphokinase [Kurthia senegalensis]|uniref:thiamine diphosphokinase n=1 Tax=Kurthia senegalensis TaxID=1033740 RepID=UPI0002880EDC|nr:thiamine diphosphokinase [Kurthia senegalensis]
MHVVICAGGPKEEVASDLLFSLQDVTWIGADHGTIYLLENGITPQLAVGDFDSLTPSEWALVQEKVAKIEKHLPEKDETDTELAIRQALLLLPDKITILGATGGRLDHYEANLHIMYRLQKEHPQCELNIVNQKNEIRFLFPRLNELVYDEKYPYVSFFPFGMSVTGVTLRGVAYETTNETIELGSTRFTSNEICREGGTISFDSSAVMMIRSVD